MYDKPTHREKKLIDERETLPNDGSVVVFTAPHVPQALPDPVGRDKKAPYTHKDVEVPPHIPESGKPYHQKSDPDDNIQGQVASDDATGT